jgi:hypothetical protein
MGMTDQVVRDAGVGAGGEALDAVERVLERARNHEMNADEALGAIGRIVERHGRRPTYQKALG